MYDIDFSGLTNTKRFAGLALPALSDCLGLTTGKVRITYDPSRTKKMRVVLSGGAGSSSEIGSQIDACVELFDTACVPFKLELLEGKVRATRETLPHLDFRKFVAGLQLIYMMSHSQPMLIGHNLELTLDVQVVRRGGKRELRARALMGRPLETTATPAAKAATKELIESIAMLWSDLVATTIGRWILDSGIEGLRFGARFQAKVEIAAKILGLALAGVKAPTVH